MKFASPAAIAAALLLAGCPKPLPPVLNVATVKASELPTEVPALLTYADAETAKDTPPALENSLVVAQAARISAREAGYWTCFARCAWTRPLSGAASAAAHAGWKKSAVATSAAVLTAVLRMRTDLIAARSHQRQRIDRVVGRDEWGNHG